MDDTANPLSAKAPSLTLTRSSQRQIFPLELVGKKPSKVNGRHNGGCGQANNGRRYVLKGQSDGHFLLPVNEWLCSVITRAAGVDTPPFEVISTRALQGRSSHSFGSEELSDVISTPSEITRIFTGIRHYPKLDQALSRLFAIDLFLNNPDRHPGNALARRASEDYDLLAIDFTTAFLIYPQPLSKLLSDPTLATHRLYSRLRQVERFDPDAAHAALDKIDELTVRSITETLVALPAEWIDDATATQLTAWWESPEKHQRVQAIRRRIDNVTSF